jgi:hypothetical protein
MSLSKSRRRSPAQRAASGANDRKSIGPKTWAGKRVASLNAVKEGASAKAVNRPIWQAVVPRSPARKRRGNIPRVHRVKGARLTLAERIQGLAAADKNNGLFVWTQKPRKRMKISNLKAC